MKRSSLVVFSVVLIAVFGVGVSTAHFWRRDGLSGEVKDAPAQKVLSAAREQTSDYGFINRTVTSNLGKHFIINFIPLRKHFERIRAQYPEKTYVYFAYLNNSSWVGLEERTLFTAASTIKVPLAMAVYKMAEQGKLDLQTKYTIQEEDLDRGFGEFYKDSLDKEYTVEQLVGVMLEQSDNTAASGVMKSLNRIGLDRPFDEIYNFMGWEFNEFGQTQTYEGINLKVLSNMFLSLYNATYINVDHSNKILEYLANTPFNDKIDAGVPEGVVASHKIGVAADKQSFSDCGIVYAPNRHYILCMGFDGGSEEKAKSFMKEISGAAYDYVINN